MEATDTSPASDAPQDAERPPAMPRWVKLTLVAVGVVLVVVLVKLVLDGGVGHGPGMHGAAPTIDRLVPSASSHVASVSSTSGSAVI